VKEKIKILSELSKIKITSFVTLTTAFGFIASAGEINLKIIPVLFGILFMACGSAAINHWQEKDVDALMSRTKNRPIPSGRISGNQVLLIALILILTGSIILLSGSGLLAFCFAALNLFWYNIVYTMLKRKNPFAIIPGSLVGAIPPMAGWAAAGGNPFDSQILIIAFFLFIWQIPHFWLLLLALDEDYRRAGFPTLTQLFSKEQLIRITFIWIISTVATGLLIPLFGLVHIPVINVLLFFSAVWLTWNAFKLLYQSNNELVFKIAFRDINVFALLVVILVSTDNLIF
jgi:protoheme IX farnesyltransferase